MSFPHIADPRDCPGQIFGVLRQSALRRALAFASVEQLVASEVEHYKTGSQDDGWIYSPVKQATTYSPGYWDSSMGRLLARRVDGENHV